MDEMPNSSCPSCKRGIQPNWLACPRCGTSLQTSIVGNKKPRLIRILVSVIVLLLLLLVGLGGLGAWWYYERSPMTVVDPIQGGEPTAITDTELLNPVPLEVEASGTPQVTALMVQDIPLSDLPLVSLSLSSDTISEDGGTAKVTAQLSGVNESDVNVKLEFSGSANGGGHDYSVSSNIIIIPAGSISGNSLITGILDSDIEGDETVIINISEVDDAAQEHREQVKITIVQTNPGPKLLLVASPVSIMESGGQAQVTLVVSETLSADISVHLSFAGSAEYGTDYYVDSRFILISAGSRTGTYSTIVGLPDNIVEGEESIRVSIGNIISDSHDTYVCSKVDEDGVSIIADSGDLGPAALNQRRAGCLVVEFRTIIINENQNNRDRSISDGVLVQSSGLI